MPSLLLTSLSFARLGLYSPVPIAAPPPPPSSGSQYAPPQNIKATASGTSIISISWDAPDTRLDGTPGTPSGYNVYCAVLTNATTGAIGPDGGNNIAGFPRTTDVSPNTANITGLTSGTTYAIVVASKDENGNIGPGSVEFPVTLP